MWMYNPQLRAGDVRRIRTRQTAPPAYRSCQPAPCRRTKGAHVARIRSAVIDFGIETKCLIGFQVHSSGTWRANSTNQSSDTVQSLELLHQSIAVKLPIAPVELRTPGSRCRKSWLQDNFPPKRYRAAPAAGMMPVIRLAAFRWRKNRSPSAAIGVCARSVIKYAIAVPGGGDKERRGSLADGWPGSAYRRAERRRYP